jgi:hypothetical protein
MSAYFEVCQSSTGPRPHDTGFVIGQRLLPR